MRPVQAHSAAPWNGCTLDAFHALIRALAFFGHGIRVRRGRESLAFWMPVVLFSSFFLLLLR